MKKIVSTTSPFATFVFPDRSWHFEDLLMRVGRVEHAEPFSPARIRIEDDAGRLLRFKDGKMHSDPTLDMYAPWLENYLLIREDAGLTRRRIIGEVVDGNTYR